MSGSNIEEIKKVMGKLYQGFNNLYWSQNITMVTKSRIII
jgi:hypothetical protein